MSKTPPKTPHLIFRMELNNLRERHRVRWRPDQRTAQCSASNSRRRSPGNWVRLQRTLTLPSIVASTIDGLFGGPVFAGIHPVVGGSTPLETSWSGMMTTRNSDRSRGQWGWPHTPSEGHTPNRPSFLDIPASRHGRRGGHPDNRQYERCFPDLLRDVVDGRLRGHDDCRGVTRRNEHQSCGEAEGYGDRTHGLLPPSTPPPHFRTIGAVLISEAAGEVGFFGLDRKFLQRDRNRRHQQ